METCNACDRAARGVVLVRASEEMVGNGLARWEPWWTCELLHRAEHLIPQVRQADPAAEVLAFTCDSELEPGHFQVQAAELFSLEGH